jgi:hypothetical protein
MRDFLCWICRGAWGGQVGLIRSVWRKLAAQWRALASRRENYPLSPTQEAGAPKGARQKRMAWEMPNPCSASDVFACRDYWSNVRVERK